MVQNSDKLIRDFISNGQALRYADGLLLPDSNGCLNSTIRSIASYLQNNRMEGDTAALLFNRVRIIEGNERETTPIKKIISLQINFDDFRKMIQKGELVAALEILHATKRRDFSAGLVPLFEKIANSNPIDPKALSLALEIFPVFSDFQNLLFLLSFLKTALLKVEENLEIEETSYRSILDQFKQDFVFVQILRSKITDTKQKSKDIINFEFESPGSRLDLFLELFDQNDFTRIKNIMEKRPWLCPIAFVCKVLSSCNSEEKAQFIIEISSRIHANEDVVEIFKTAISHHTLSHELILILMNAGFRPSILALKSILPDIMKGGYEHLFNSFFEFSFINTIHPEFFFYDGESKVPRALFEKIVQIFSPETLRFYLNQQDRHLLKNNVLSSWPPDIIQQIFQTEDLTPYLTSLSLNPRVKEIHLQQIYGELFNQDVIIQSLQISFQAWNLVLFEELSKNHLDVLQRWIIQKKWTATENQTINDIFPALERLIDLEPSFVQILKNRDILLKIFTNPHYPGGFLKKILGDEAFPLDATQSHPIVLQKKEQVLDLIDLDVLSFYDHRGLNIFHQLVDLSGSLFLILSVCEELNDPSWKMDQMLNEEWEGMNPIERWLSETQDAYLTDDMYQRLEQLGFKFSIEKSAGLLIETGCFSVLNRFEKGIGSPIHAYLTALNSEGVSKIEKILQSDLTNTFLWVKLGIEAGIRLPASVASVIERNISEELFELLIRNSDLTYDVVECLLKTRLASSFINKICDLDLLPIYRERFAATLSKMILKERTALIHYLLLAKIKWQTLFDDLDSLLETTIGLEGSMIFQLLENGIRFPPDSVYKLLRTNNGYPTFSKLIEQALEDNPKEFYQSILENLQSVNDSLCQKIFMDIKQEHISLVLDLSRKTNTKNQVLFLRIIFSFRKQSRILLDSWMNDYSNSWREEKDKEYFTRALGLNLFYGEDLNIFFNLSESLFVEGAKSLILDLTFTKLESLKDLIDFIENVHKASDLFDSIEKVNLTTVQKFEILSRLITIGKDEELFRRWVIQKPEQTDLFQLALRNESSLLKSKLIRYEFEHHQERALQYIADNILILPPSDTREIMSILPLRDKEAVVRKIVQLPLKIQEINYIMENRSLNYSKEDEISLAPLLIPWLSYQDSDGQTLFIYNSSLGKWELCEFCLLRPESLLTGVNRMGYSASDYLIGSPLFIRYLQVLSNQSKFNFEELKKSLYKVPKDQAFQFLSNIDKFQDTPLNSLEGCQLIQEFLQFFYIDLFPIPPIENLAMAKDISLYIQSAQNFQFTLVPAHFSIETQSIEIPWIPPNLIDYRSLLEYFHSFVPKETFAIDQGYRVSYNELEEKLNKLFEYIQNEVLISPLPIDPQERHQEYEKLKNLYRNLISYWSKSKESERIRSGLIEIAKGGPPYCSTKWFSEAEFELEQWLIAPDQQLTAEMEIYKILEELRRGVFYEIVQNLNQSIFPESPGNHLHTPVELNYLLRADSNEQLAPEGRGLRIFHEVKPDVFGPQITRAYALEEFDKRYTPQRIIRTVAERLNSFQISSLKKNLLEDWLIEHLFPKKRFEITADEVKLLEETAVAIRQKKRPKLSDSQEMQNLIFPPGSRDLSLLIEQLSDLSKISPEPLLKTLLLGLPYEGPDEEKMGLESLQEDPRFNQVIAESLVKGDRLRLINQGMRPHEALQEESKLILKCTKFLQDSAFRKGAYQILSAGQNEHLIQRFLELDRLESEIGAILSIAQQAGIPLTKDDLRGDLAQIDLYKVLEQALRKDKIQQVKTDLYERDPETQEFLQYDENNFLIESRYQNLVATRVHFKEEIITEMLKYLHVLRPRTLT